MTFVKLCEEVKTFQSFQSPYNQFLLVAQHLLALETTKPSVCTNNLYYFHTLLGEKVESIFVSKW